VFQYYGVLNNYSVYFFASILIIEGIVQSLMYVVILYSLKDLNFKKLKPSLKIGIQLLKSSFPLLISNFVIVLYIAIDDFFINYFLGSEANGSFYVVQFLVIFITWNIGAAFVFGLYPALAECYLVNKTLYAKRLKFMLYTLLSFGFSIGLFYQFFGNYIMETFYHSSFYNAKLPLKIFAWSPLFIFIGMLFEKHLVNQDQLQRNAYRFILGCIVNATLCIILIPEYKLEGAALAVLLSHFTTNVVYILCYKSYRINIVKLIFSY
jgi:O-antigen/teichoic acid export membrane protein